MNKVIATATGLTADHRNPDKLRSFKSAVLWWLRELVTSLELVRGTYDIRYNQNQGTLQTEHYIVSVGLETILLADNGVMYQVCEGRADYTGEEPQWFNPRVNKVIELLPLLEALAQGTEYATDMLQGEKVLQGT